MKKRFIQAILASLLMVNLSQVHAELPSDSVYHLTADWRTENNETIRLSSLQGRKQVVAMIYTHCLHACPVIVAALKHMDAELHARGDSTVSFVLISLTPESDTPEILKAFAVEQNLDDSNWALLNGAAPDVRSLAMALDIKYKVVDGSEVAHSNVFSVLDEQGSILLQAPGTVAGALKAVATLHPQ